MKENKIEKLILDLSNRWECTPQEAVDRLNSMNESEINKLINSMTKKFKNGGFIDCLRAGGTIPQCKKCGGNLIRKGATGFDTDEVVPDLSKYKFYGRDWYTNNNGSKYSVETIATKREDLPANWDTNPEAQQNMGEFDPDIMQRIIEKGDTLLFRNNYFVPKGSGDWKRSNAVIDSLGVRAGVKKAQDGTALTRRDAIDALRNKGFSRSQARLAYQNQKNALRNNGFFGNEMRQAARRNIIESTHPRAVEETPNIEPMSTGPQINMPSNKLVAKDLGIAPITRSDRPDVITFSGQSFGEAFNNARKMGLSEFAWQGGEYDRYHTGLEKKSFMEGVQDKNQQRVEARDNMVQSAITQAKTAPKWWQRLGNAFMAGTLVND